MGRGEAGATPIDYHTQDFVEVSHAAEPAGLDVVFEGIGGSTILRGFSVLRRGGKLVAYGKAGEFYGITALYRKDRGPFMSDLPILFDLLGAEKLKPHIGAKFPVLEPPQRMNCSKAAGRMAKSFSWRQSYWRHRDEPAEIRRILSQRPALQSNGPRIVSADRLPGLDAREQTAASPGGSIVQHFAADHPDLVRRLVIHSSA